MASDEAVHGVGDRDQRQGAELIRDRGKIGRFLRIAAEQNGVAGLKQRIDVVMAGHDVERMLGDDAGRDLQHKAADPLADRDVMRLQPVEDALAGRGVGNVFAAGQRRAERAALRGMFAFRLEEERVVAPDVAAAAGAKRLVDFRDLRGRCDWIADDPAAHMTHHLGDGAVAMDNARNPRIFHAHLVCPFHLFCLFYRRLHVEKTVTHLTQSPRSRI